MYAWREVCVNVNMTERLYVMYLCNCQCLCHYGTVGRKHQKYRNKLTFDPDFDPGYRSQGSQFRKK